MRTASRLERPALPMCEPPRPKADTCTPVRPRTRYGIGPPGEFMNCSPFPTVRLGTCGRVSGPGHLPQFVLNLFQVSHKLFVMLMALPFVRRPQDSRRMDRRGHILCPGMVHELATLFRKAIGSAEQG